MKMKNLYGYKLNTTVNIVDVGGGYGDMTLKLISAGYKVKAFIEPDNLKFSVAEKLFGAEIKCLCCRIGDAKIINSICDIDTITVVMQDVIEHVPLEEQKSFFEDLRCRGIKVTLIGRTPNLKSPFGLRNSFGDNTHIYRFTDRSLRDFLSELGFKNISISSEPYKITGLVSLARSVFYFLTIFLVAVAFIAIYGSREGWMAPNLVFKAE